MDEKEKDIMKVLWFEVTTPSGYRGGDAPIAGWQDSLEQIVRQCPNVELSVAFYGNPGECEKCVDGVSYYPLTPDYSRWSRVYSNFSNRWNTVNKLLPLAMKCIERIKPDLIQVFGTECEFGQVARHTSIPVVVHMQGSVNPYLDSEFPPRYSFLDKVVSDGFHVKTQWANFRGRHFNASWRELEQSNYKAVAYYMGRTDWDRKLVEIFHPGAKYFKVWEALRPSFIGSKKLWQPKSGSKLKLMTIGCSSHWKGMDTLLRTAHVLKESGLDFEWTVAGNMDTIKKQIELKEGLRFANNQVRILGFTDADELAKRLLSADIYVHTAYIDNSPNSVCEAQYLGLPVVATRVGGIPSLVEDGKGGVLVPANSCYEMAYEIISLSRDKKRQQAYSVYNRAVATDRHNPDHILNDLLHCYQSILQTS